MDLQGKRFLLIGGAGLIGSHLLDQLLQEDIKEAVVFDNFSRVWLFAWVRQQVQPISRWIYAPCRPMVCSVMFLKHDLFGFSKLDGYVQSI